MKITIVHDELGEWEALYVDGKLFAEGHSLRTHDWIELMIRRGFINSVENKSINNKKYDYDYSDGNRHADPTFHEDLESFEDDDFEL